MDFKNEQFREYCYLGDLDLVKNFYSQHCPDVNSKNKLNGWLVLQLNSLIIEMKIRII